MLDTLREALTIKDYLVKIRRHLHENPEQSFKEFETSALIKRELEGMGIPFSEVTPTGVVGFIRGGRPGKTIGLRADIDALPIDELTDLPFKSKVEGVMHACGHDAHTSSLLGAAKILNAIKDDISGNIYLIFQPAEELVSGAFAMLKAAPELFGEIDHYFGIHYFPSIACGKYTYSEGVLSSTGEGVRIEIKGKSAHGSTPYLGIDAMYVIGLVANAAMSVVSRTLPAGERATVTFGKLVSGTTLNTIAGDAYMEGTVRCFSEETKEKINQALENICTYIPKAFGAEGKFIIDTYVPGMVNHADGVAIFKEAVKNLGQEGNLMNVNAFAGSDDMAFFLKKAPGCYAVIGSGKEDGPYEVGLHNPRTMLNEDCLPAGVGILAQYALVYLSK